MYATASRWKRTRARVRSNISRSDPSGTVGIQRSYIADLNRRWKKVARAIQELVVTDDALRLGPVKSLFPSIPVAASLATNIQHGVPFAVSSSIAQHEEFMAWLNQKMDEDVLEVGGRAVGGRITRNSKWQDQYVRASYGRGLNHAQRSMKQQGISFDSRTAVDLFNAPIHRDTLALMYTRQFSDLQGITQATSTQISRSLTEGLATGKGPRDMARSMRKVISGMSVNRSRTLARTEVIRVHAESTLNRYKDAGLQKVNVLAEFATGKDDRVCPICIGLETGEALVLDQARGMIPQHPNCRCVWLPVTSAKALKPKQPPQTPWRSTDQLHGTKMPDGSYGPPYSAERARLHQRLVDDHFNRIPHATKAGKYVKGTVRPVANPTAEVLGGGPSAGKGTAVMKNTKFTRNRVHIDADEIKAMLPEYNTAVARGSTQASSIVHAESSHISQLIADRAAKGKYNFLMDGTGDGSFEKLIERLARYRSGGARVSAHYVTIDTEVAVARSAIRGAKSGRFVPNEYIRQVHSRLSTVVPRALNEGHFDDFVLWDNNGKKAFRVAKMTDGKLEILDPKAWQRFLDKAPGATPVPVPVPPTPSLPPLNFTTKEGAIRYAVAIADEVAPEFIERTSVANLRQILGGLTDSSVRHGVRLKYIHLTRKGTKSLARGGADAEGRGIVMFQRTQLADNTNAIAKKTHRVFLSNQSYNTARLKNAIAVQRRDPKRLGHSVLANNERKLARVEAATRWTAGSVSKRPMYSIAAHEGYHTVYYSYKLEHRWHLALDKYRIEGDNNLSWYRVSEYGASSSSELFAEVGALVTEGRSAEVPAHILKAFNETVESISR